MERIEILNKANVQPKIWIVHDGIEIHIKENTYIEKSAAAALQNVTESAVEKGTKEYLKKERKEINNNPLIKNKAKLLDSNNTLNHKAEVKKIIKNRLISEWKKRIGQRKFNDRLGQLVDIAEKIWNEVK